MRVARRAAREDQASNEGLAAAGGSESFEVSMKRPKRRHV